MKTDWESIRAAYKAGLHAFNPVEGGWQAHNPGQQWTAKFDGRGFIAQPQGGGWQWGLELQSYGFGEQQQAVTGTPSVKAEGTRLSYDWDANVQEWFVNDQRGLEHGFTVAQRPAQTSPSRPVSSSQSLSFTLTTRGTLRPTITADGLGVFYRDSSGATVLNYTGLKVWDADGKVLASHFAPVESGVRLVVDERGARYPLTIDPIAQQAYLKPAAFGTSQANDNLGWSVTVSGDTVVVGVPWERSSTTGVNSTPNETGSSGAAYVFVSNGTTWTQQAYLKASNTGINDQFGHSVALSGNTLVVGARGESSSTTGVNSTPNELSSFSGAAYVFVRNGTTWTQQAYLKASNTGANDQFGYSVAVSGDTLIVGGIGEDSITTGVNTTPSDNGSADNSGAAYVFVRNGTTWTEQAYLKASNTGASDSFGGSVGISGDTVVVGASLEDSSTTGVNSTPNDNGINFNSGAAYVFVRNGTTWAEQAYLKASNPGASDTFGGSVAVSADTAVVGAYGEASSTTGVNNTPNEASAGSGAAYVFVRSGAVWTQQAFLKASNTGPADFFGHSVAISGETVAVGAIYEDSSTTGVNTTPDELTSSSGAVYVFLRNVATWTQQAYLKASNPGVDDQFGRSVAVSAGTVIVGSPFEDSSTAGVDSTPNELANEAGAAYVFDGLGPAVIAAPTITGISPSSGSTVEGTSVVLTGSGFTEASAVTFDGTAATNFTVNSSTQITVITPIHSAGLVDVTVTAMGGSVTAADLFTYVVPVPTIISISPASSGTAGGTGVTITGTALTDASLVTFGGTAATNVAVNSPTQITVSTPAHSAGLVDVTVTTPGGTALGTGFYTYLNDAALSIAQQAWLKASNTGAIDHFGYSVAVSGDTVVVGATQESSSTTGVNSTPNELAYASGAVYVFVRNGTTWTQQAYLKASNTGADDSFGFSVAVSGDTLIVGATGEDSSTAGVNSTPNEIASGAGAAYVFVRNGTTWTQQAYLKASNVGANDEFGRSVAISGDTVVVGAYAEDSATTGVNSTPDELSNSSGAAYVFVRNGTTWTQQAYLKASNPGANNYFDFFGWSVAVSGNTVVVGAYDEASSTTGVNSTPNELAYQAGAAYVFTRSAGLWSQQAYLKASNSGESDHFGISVAVSGGKVVVGAREEDGSTSGVNSLPDESASNSGAAYVFAYTGTAWTQQAYLKASNPGTDDAFGTSVAVAGDTVVVGAAVERSSTTGVDGTPDELAFAAGAAYIFNGPGPLVLEPEIALEQPIGVSLTSGASSIGYGVVTLGSSSAAKTFTIQNTGPGALAIASVSVIGGNASDFAVSTTGMLTNVPANTGSTSFSVIFTPSAGSRTTMLRIVNDDTNEGNFDITLNGTGLSFTLDTDADGLNDASEFQMAALGFDWQVSQPGLVGTYTSSANGAGYFTPSQVQALNVGVPLIQKNPTTGVFTLTIGVQKSTTLLPGSFNALPMTAPQTLINGAGQLEFQFTAPDSAAFFRLQSQ